MKKYLTPGLAIIFLFSNSCSSSSSTVQTVNSPSSTVQNGNGQSKIIRVYVSGESIEKRNNFIEAPFTATGSLNERGGGELRNDTEEYGWMVPFADRLKLREPKLQVEFVGTDT